MSSGRVQDFLKAGEARQGTCRRRPTSYAQAAGRKVRRLSISAIQSSRWGSLYNRWIAGRFSLAAGPRTAIYVLELPRRS